MRGVGAPTLRISIVSSTAASASADARAARDADADAGAGAAALACLDLLVAMGARRENITVCDIEGVVYEGRQVLMDPYKARYARDTEARTLAEAPSLLVAVDPGGRALGRALRTLGPAGVAYVETANPLRRLQVRALLAAWLQGEARSVEVGLHGYLRSATGATEWMPWRKNAVRPRPAVERVLAANQDKVAEYRGGKEKLFGFFVGQSMKAMGGKANPGVVNERLKAKLG